MDSFSYAFFEIIVYCLYACVTHCMVEGATKNTSVYGSMW